MTSLYADAEAAIRSRVNSNLTSIDATYIEAAHVVWPNVSTSMEGKDHWMQADIDFTSAEKLTLGAMRKIEGNLILTFVARNKLGIDELMARMDNARDLFPSGTTASSGTANVRFHEPRPSPIVYSEDGYAYQPLICPFFLHGA